MLKKCTAYYNKTSQRVRPVFVNLHKFFRMFVSGTGNTSVKDIIYFILSYHPITKERSTNFMVYQAILA